MRRDRRGRTFSRRSIKLHFDPTALVTSRGTSTGFHGTGVQFARNGSVRDSNRVEWAWGGKRGGGGDGGGGEGGGGEGEGGEGLAGGGGEQVAPSTKLETN